LKFEAQLRITRYQFKNTKLDHKGALSGSRDQLLNFGTPLISRERLKIQTSNFACCLIVRDTKKKLKMGQKGTWPRSHDLLFKFWDPPNISGTAEDTNLKFCMLFDHMGY